MPFEKVYWKGLRIVLDKARRYMQGHQTQLAANLDAGQYASVVTALEAVVACLNELPVDTPIE